MGKSVLTATIAVAFLALALGASQIVGAGPEGSLPSKSDASCLKCHEYDKESNVLAGKVADVSSKAKTIQLQIGKDMEVIYFDDKTVLKNAPSFKKIPKQEPVKVVYAQKNGKTYAQEVVVKKGLEVPKEQLASVEEVAKLVAMGPEKGKYVLIDSRPGELYDEGHIPTAKKLPFFMFDTLQEKVLPENKDVLQIYYCGGLSCVLSPLSARKAEKLGYKNVKVFRAGLPAWRKAGHLIVSNVDALERYNKEDLSYILIDLRPAAKVKKAHVPKAVAVREKGLTAMKEQFPKYKGAEIILYNEDGNLDSARNSFKEIRQWGYTNVSVLSGGFSAWKKAHKQVATGPAGTRISYVRKLRPGEFEVEAFKALVEKPKGEILILDVRTSKEIEESSLPNAKAIPLDELESRISELPHNKTILIHCSTGVRAEMAYNILKKAGYNAKYVKAKVDFDKEKKGVYTIEE